MKERTRSLEPWKPTALLGVALALLFGYVTANAWGLAARKPLWIDEARAFELVVSRQSPVQLLLRGADVQVSAAPLDFVILRSAYLARDVLQYAGLHPLQYFRAHYILLMALVAFLLMGLIVRIEGGLAGAVFVGVLVPFLLQADVFPFWAEMRSYGTWLALAFAFLFLAEYAEGRRVAWALVCTFLALAATASVLLLAAWGAAFVLVGLIRRRSIRSFAVDPRVLTVTAAGLLTLYYMLRSVPAPYYAPVWDAFLRFWLAFWPAIAVGIALTVLDLRAARPARAVSALTATLWLASGIAVFGLLEQRSYFFAPRQMIYFHAATAWLSFHAIRTVVEATRGRHNAKLAAILVATAFLLLRTGYGRAPELTDWRRLPVEPRGLSEIAGPVPAEFQFVDLYRVPNRQSGQWWTEVELNICGRINFELWWDYLNSTAPVASMRRAPGKTLVVGPYDATPICQEPCAGVEVLRVR